MAENHWVSYSLILVKDEVWYRAGCACGVMSRKIPNRKLARKWMRYHIREVAGVKDDSEVRVKIVQRNVFVAIEGKVRQRWVTVLADSGSVLMVSDEESLLEWEKTVKGHGFTVVDPTPEEHEVRILPEECLKHDDGPIVCYVATCSCGSGVAGPSSERGDMVLWRRNHHVENGIDTARSSVGRLREPIRFPGRD